MTPHSLLSVLLSPGLSPSSLVSLLLPSRIASCKELKSYSLTLCDFPHALPLVFSSIQWLMHLSLAAPQPSTGRMIPPNNCQKQTAGPASPLVQAVLSLIPLCPTCVVLFQAWPSGASPKCKCCAEAVSHWCSELDLCSCPMLYFLYRFSAIKRSIYIHHLFFYAHSRWIGWQIRMLYFLYWC